MSPHTVHLIAQDIRNWRSELTAKEKWAQAMPKSDMRDEFFRYINYLRSEIKRFEQNLAQM